VNFDWTLNWGHIGALLVIAMGLGKLATEVRRLSVVVDKLWDKAATHDVEIAVLKARSGLQKTAGA
jgi:hypothetical protein